MNQANAGRVVTPSLFDRLTDHEPRKTTDPATTNWDLMKRFKDAVARDLTELLNVRRSELDIPEEFVETNRSIAAYGLRDLGVSPVDTEQIRRSIERCVRTFEPRLSHVTVHFTATDKFRLDFRISATLQVDLRGELVMFEAVLPTHSRRFQVSEAR